MNLRMTVKTKILIKLGNSAMEVDHGPIHIRAIRA